MRPEPLPCPSVAGLLCALLVGPARADSFVLVHGAWVGEWAWDAVAPLLEAEGHDVAAVSLKGQGLRAAEGGPAVSVEDHVADVVAAIEAAPSDTVILVAHSYGGRPATGAWDRARGLVDHVVFVEAPAPYRDPPVGAPLLPADDGSLAFVVMTYPDLADSGMMPPPPGMSDEPGRPLAPMSLRALYGAVPSAGGPLPPTPCTYVHAEASALPVLARVGEAMRDGRGCGLREVPGGHDVPSAAPEALAAILLEVAEAS